jgi:hypothetical protein
VPRSSYRLQAAREILIADTADPYSNSLCRLQETIVPPARGSDARGFWLFMLYFVKELRKEPNLNPFGTVVNSDIYSSGRSVVKKPFRALRIYVTPGDAAQGKVQKRRLYRVEQKKCHRDTRMSCRCPTTTRVEAMTEIVNIS